MLRCRKDDELAERVERAKIRVRDERDRRQFEEALERVKVLIADRNYEEARRLLKALEADAITPQQKESVKRLFKRIFEEEDQKKDFFAETTQQSPDRPQQGRGKSENTVGQPPKGKQQPQESADQPSGKGDPGGFFGNNEDPKPAPGKKNGGGKAKPTPDNKPKKDPKNETQKGYSLEEFKF